MTPQFGSKAPVWFIYFHFFVRFLFCFLVSNTVNQMCYTALIFILEQRAETYLTKRNHSGQSSSRDARGRRWVKRERCPWETRRGHTGVKEPRAAAAWEREDKASARLGRKARGMNFTRTARSTPHRKRVRAADSSTVSLRLTETIHRSVFSVTMASDWAYGHELSLVKTLKECARNWVHDKANR